MASSLTWQMPQTPEIPGLVSIYQGNVGRGRPLLADDNMRGRLDDLLVNGDGWTLSQAIGINEVGQITGNGFINGALHAFVLTPVPEPEIGLLFLAGVGVVVAAARRGKAHQP